MDGASVKYGELTYRQKKVMSDDDPNKPKYQYKHFFKKYNDLHNPPAREVALMEFFRLMVPRQPKFRYYAEIIDGRKIEYVQSKEIPNHKKYIDNNPIHKGIMEVCFIGVFVLRDQDAALHNHLEDDANWVYRIDGGLAGFFNDTHQLTKDHNFPEEKIRNFSVQFREEFYAALLKFLVCTDSLVDAWSNHYHHEETIYSKERNYTIKNDALALKRIRHNMLHYLTYRDIKAFILSEEAAKIYTQHRSHVADFCVKGKMKLVNNPKILEEMDHKFEFLKHLAKMEQYSDDESSDNTSPQAKIDFLLKHVNVLKGKLQELQTTYPHLGGTTYFQTPLNTPMGNLISQLIDRTEKYIQTITKKLEHLSATEYLQTLNSDHTQFKKELNDIIHDPKYAQLHQLNTRSYWVHYLCIFVIRGFFRIFDILFNFGNPLYNRPHYHPVFFYPQSSLKPTIDKMTSEINNELSACDKSFQL